MVYGFSGIFGLTVGGILADRLHAKRVDGETNRGVGQFYLSMSPVSA